jgi:hypothetical protein
MMTPWNDAAGGRSQWTDGAKALARMAPSTAREAA